ASHTTAVPSVLADARYLPSGLKATLPTPPLCPPSVNLTLPVAGSHTLTVRSQAPLASHFPSGLKATLFTPDPSTRNTIRLGLSRGRLRCPRKVSSGRPVRAFHTRTVLSSPDEAMRLPSGLKATDQRGFVCPRRERV